MTSQQPELIARRGLTLPEPTLTRLRTVGIWFDANLTVQCRDQDTGSFVARNRDPCSASKSPTAWSIAYCISNTTARRRIGLINRPSTRFSDLDQMPVRIEESEAWRSKSYLCFSSTAIPLSASRGSSPPEPQFLPATNNPQPNTELIRDALLRSESVPGADFERGRHLSLY
jgi:hypothetical protein